MSLLFVSSTTAKLNCILVFQSSEKLVILTEYLRDVHHYCVWCGTSYTGITILFFLQT